MLIAGDDVGVDSKDRKGWTLLSFVAWRGHEVVEELFYATDSDDMESKDNSG